MKFFIFSLHYCLKIFKELKALIKPRDNKEQIWADWIFAKQNIIFRRHRTLSKPAMYFILGASSKQTYFSFESQWPQIKCHTTWSRISYPVTFVVDRPVYKQIAKHAILHLRGGVRQHSMERKVSRNFTTLTVRIGTSLFTFHKPLLVTINLYQ